MTGQLAFGLPPLFGDVTIAVLILNGFLGSVSLYGRQRRLGRQSGASFSGAEEGDAAMRAMGRGEDGVLDDDFVDIDGRQGSTGRTGVTDDA